MNRMTREANEYFGLQAGCPQARRRQARLRKAALACESRPLCKRPRADPGPAATLASGRRATLRSLLVAS